MQVSQEDHVSKHSSKKSQWPVWIYRWDLLWSMYASDQILFFISMAAIITSYLTTGQCKNVQEIYKPNAFADPDHTTFYTSFSSFMKILSLSWLKINTCMTIIYYLKIVKILCISFNSPKKIPQKYFPQHPWNSICLLTVGWLITIQFWSLSVYSK